MTERSADLVADIGPRRSGRIAPNRDPACAWFECGEQSASLVGLTHRWLIKGVMVIGFLIAVIAGVAVWLEMVVALFGPQNWRFPLSTHLAQRVREILANRERWERLPGPGPSALRCRHHGPCRRYGRRR